MKFKDKSRSIEMLCPVCADTQFQLAEDDSLFTCNSCASKFTRDELIEANAENIDQHKKEVADQAVKDVKQHLEKEIKNIFKNSKVFKVK